MKRPPRRCTGLGARRVNFDIIDVLYVVAEFHRSTGYFSRTLVLFEDAILCWENAKSKTVPKTAGVTVTRFLSGSRYQSFHSERACVSWTGVCVLSDIDDVELSTGTHSGAAADMPEVRIEVASLVVPEFRTVRIAALPAYRETPVESVGILFRYRYRPPQREVDTGSLERDIVDRRIVVEDSFSSTGWMSECAHIRKRPGFSRI